MFGVEVIFQIIFTVESFLTEVTVETVAEAALVTASDDNQAFTPATKSSPLSFLKIVSTIAFIYVEGDRPPNCSDLYSESDQWGDKWLGQWGVRPFVFVFVFRAGMNDWSRLMELMRCAAIPPERDRLPLAFHRPLLPANTLFNSTNTYENTNTNAHTNTALFTFRHVAQFNCTHVSNFLIGKELNH